MEYQAIKKCFYSPSYMLTRAEVTRRLDVRFRIICQIKLISESWHILFGKIKEINERSLNAKHFYLTQYPAERKSPLLTLQQHRARKYQSFCCRQKASEASLKHRGTAFCCMLNLFPLLFHSFEKYEITNDTLQSTIRPSGKKVLHT